MTNEPRGFITTMQDVKTLALYTLSLLPHPVSLSQLYALSYQDDRLSYFDLSLSMPELVKTGHVAMEEERYAITELGRTDLQVLQTDLVPSLRQRVRDAVEQFLAAEKKAESVLCELRERDDGLYDVVMTQTSPMGQLLRLELMAPNLNQARVVEKAWRANSDAVVRAAMTALTSGKP